MYLKLNQMYLHLSIITKINKILVNNVVHIGPNAFTNVKELNLILK